MSIDLLRRRFAMGLMPTDIIINRKWSDNDAALMDVIYEQKWSKSPDYMTKREAEAVTDISRAFRGNTAITDFSTFSYFTSVTTVPKEAFRNCTSLQTIVIPNSVTKIDGYSSDGAFMGASSLSNVQLSNRLKEIGRYAFYSCSSLTSIDLPDTLEKIDYYAFHYARLETIHIPKMVKDFGGVPFTVARLKEITVDNNNATYDSRNNCNAVIKKSTNSLVMGCCNTIIPDDVVGIDGNSFTGVTFNTNVTFPNALKSIGNNAFLSCTINNDIVLPQSITNIGSGAFQSCKLKNFTITDGATCSIGNYAFNGATIIKDMYIPSGVSYSGMTGTSDVNVFTNITIEGTLTILVKYFGRRVLYDAKIKTLILNQDEIISIGFQALGVNTSYYSKNLTTLNLPNIETIDSYIIDYNVMEKVTCGKNLKFMSLLHRNNCPTHFYIEATTPELTETSFGQTIFHVPLSAREYYETTAGWSDLNAAGKLDFIEEL